MIRKRVSLFGSALREISEGSTTSATFTTLVPLVIRGGGAGVAEVEAAGIRLMLGITSRTSNNGTPLSLSVFLEQNDSLNRWQPLPETTFTAQLTATAFETMEIYPGLDRRDNTFGASTRSMLLPEKIRAVAKLQGSITATPGMTFFLDAELFS